MALSDEDRAFLETNNSAAMITYGSDGLAKVARVGVGLVDGKLWSSGTADRVRTGRLRKDPRCTLYVHDAGWRWLAMETTVSILDGPEAPARNLQLFRQMQGRPSGPLNWFGGELSEENFLAAMVEEQRLIYEFDVHHTYGLQLPPP